MSHCDVTSCDVMTSHRNVTWCLDVRPGHHVITKDFLLEILTRRARRGRAHQRSGGFIFIIIKYMTYHSDTQLLHLRTVDCICTKTNLFSEANIREQQLDQALGLVDNAWSFKFCQMAKFKRPRVWCSRRFLFCWFVHLAFFSYFFIELHHGAEHLFIQLLESTIEYITQ